MSRTIKITLAVSIILNIVLIGVLLGTFSHRIVGHTAMDKHMKEVIGRLPEKKQDLVRDTMMQLHSETSETRRKVKRKRDELIKILTAPKFNEQLFDRKAAELHEIMGELAEEIASAAKKIAGELDQDERKELAEIMRMRHGRRQFHGAWNRGAEDGKSGWDRGPSENENSTQ